MGRNKRLLSIVLIVFLMTFFFIFAGCSAESGGGSTGNKADGSIVDTEIKTSTEGSPTRKIIYNASISLQVEDITQGLSNLKQKINSDEWVESSSVNANYASVVVRVKSDRLNAFLTSLESFGDVENYSIDSYDVSESYYDNTVKKTTLETEQEALLALLEEATTIADILKITERLSEIEVELQNVNGTLNKYDSLIDYSTVTIRMYTQVTYQEDSFWEKVGFGLGIGLEILEGILIFVLCLLPFAVLAGVIVLLILFFVKKNKRKKQQKPTNTQTLDGNKKTD